MKASVIKKTLVLTLVLVTGSALAEWVKVGQSKNNTYYIDTATIRKEGDLRIAWVINDLKLKDPEGSMSMRSRMKFDCKNELMSLMGLSKFSEAMAGGEQIYSSRNDSDDWNDIPPKTVSEQVLKAVCAK